MKKNIKLNNNLFAEIKQLIEQTKIRVANSINSELCILYWKIGKTINTEILNNKRAGYGEEIIIDLSKKLTNEFGKGWSEKQISHCQRSAETFSKEQILYAVSRQLTWTHLRSLMYIDNKIKRSFYFEICINEKWSTRLLQERINSMLFERTSISKNSEETIKRDLRLLKEEQKLSADLVFRDPYILNFLGLSDIYSEQDLESAIISEIQKFIIEFGSDFAFVARQKRITVDNRDYYIDLPFFHRKLKCLIAIELKLGEFEAAYKGQMELYLNYLDKYERLHGESQPIGLILCTGKNYEHIELMKLNDSNIKIAEYMTELPPKKILLDKLRKAVNLAKNKEIVK